MKKSIMIMVTVLAVIMVSCNPQRQVQKAIKTVTFNDTAFNHVGRLWEKFNPCINDTVILSDTISDPIFIDAEIDVDSLRLILCDSSRPQPTIIRVPAKCPPHQVITKIVRDTRHEGIIRDSLDHQTNLRRQYESELRAAIASQKRCEDDFRAQTKDFGKALTKRTLITVIPALLIIALLLFALFKKKKQNILS